MKYGSNQKEYNDDELKSKSGPTAIFLWVWNFFANLITDIKNGELLSRFSFLDAMFQFVIAVATSCHPQDDPELDEKPETSSKEKDIKPFAGEGRTLRSRTATANS
ncbi:hypothetical protein JTE90_016381 [Oedothorax gibbosus]|uniref:Uncharacterized protein n=1 Tax=Oedothorax gibbosus TaxID=931172 RepID=A0AAV6UA24_9ARAC|nr:hypothetical protein JTE90_016381 [Oedothorax gibbosus]